MAFISLINMSEAKRLYGNESSAVIDIAMASQARAFQGTHSSSVSWVIGWLQANPDGACSRKPLSRAWMLGQMPERYLCVNGTCVIHSGGVSKHKCQITCKHMLNVVSYEQSLLP